MSRRVTYYNSSFASALTWAGVFGANYYDHWRAWDAGSLTLTGALVDSAASLTGSGRNMVATGGNRPSVITDATLVKNVFEFDGVSEYLKVNSSTGDYNFLHDGSGGTVIIVSKIIGANPNNVQFFLGNTSGSSLDTGYFIAYEDRSTQGKNNSIRQVVTKGSAGNIVSSLLTSDNYFLTEQFNALINTVDGDNATVSDRSKLVNNNGTAFGNNTETNSPSLLNASGNLIIGATRTGALFLNANVAEILIFDKIFDATDYANAQTILNQDYGTFPIS